MHDSTGNAAYLVKTVLTKAGENAQPSATLVTLGARGRGRGFLDHVAREPLRFHRCRSC